jgi:hypothetical protein
VSDGLLSAELNSKNQLEKVTIQTTWQQKKSLYGFQKGVENKTVTVINFRFLFINIFIRYSLLPIRSFPSLLCLFSFFRTNFYHFIITFLFNTAQLKVYLYFFIF